MDKNLNKDLGSSLSGNGKRGLGIDFASFLYGGGEMPTEEKTTEDVATPENEGEAKSEDVMSEGGSEEQSPPPSEDNAEGEMESNPETEGEPETEVDEEALKIAEELLSLVGGSEDQTVSDTASELKDIIDTAKDSGGNNEELMNKIAELEDKVLSSDMSSQAEKRKIQKLQEMLDNAQNTINDYELGNARSRKIMDIIEGNQGLKDFVSIYNAYEKGDKSVEGDLMSSLGDMVKQVYGVDLNTLMNKQSDTTKKMVQPIEDGGKVIKKEENENQGKIPGLRKMIMG